MMDPTGLPPTRTETALVRVAPSGERSALSRALAEECPVALEYDGIGYAVLMATPADLVDLAYGFSRTERLIDEPGQIRFVEPFVTDRGVIVRIGLSPDVRPRVGERVRHRASDSSCGLCGIENLEQALRDLPRVQERPLAREAAVFRAYHALSDHQPLNAETGAVHAAAACSAGGELLLVREDVGRHNAFDKLIGAMLQAGHAWNGGFALLSSRCSYELVEKAALAGCPMLATVSAPTALATSRAREAGLALRVLVRRDALLALDP
jgi:FdhD protein